MKLKTTAGLLAAALFASVMLTGYSYPQYPGLGSVYYESEVNIAPNTVYSEKVAKNDTAGGIEHVYTVEASLMNGIMKPYAFVGEIRGKYTLSSMVNYAKQDGYNVVAAINGDLYDTGSGTPKGPVIHNGVLMTGGYAPEHSIAFSQNGAGYLSYSGINYVMKYKKYNYTDQSVPKTDENGNPVYDETGNPVMDTVTESKITDETRNIDFFNVPHGGANGLHLFNRHYASSTKTSGTCVEVILTVPDVTVANLKVGETVKAKVTKVNTSVSNTPIAENQLVLSTKSGSASYSDLWNMVPDSEVEITVTAAEGSLLDQAVESIGVYNVLAQNGSVTTTDKTINPRTCIGIKENGEIILYIVDGRQSSHSKGMNGVDIANYLVSLGCTAVVNLDGGGSTTMFARNQPGINDEAVQVNKVSDGSLRNLANGLMLVYSSTSDMTPAHLSVYPSYTLMMPGASQQLDVYAVNSNYEKTSNLSGHITYTVPEGFGSVNGNSVYTAGTSLGETTITAAVGDVTGSTKVKIVDDFTFTTNVTSFAAAPGETKDINVINPKYGYTDVVIADNLFKWACDPNIGTIDQNGLFTAASNAKGESGNITVTLNAQKLTIPVSVGTETSFTDIGGHWAYDYIVELSNEGIITGVSASKFEPDGGLTRAQMLVLLSKLDADANISGSPASSFTDVKAEDWYYNYVNWGVANKIVSGMGDGTFAPNSKVTREQMCVMLNNFADLIGLQFEAEQKDLAFSDNNKMSSWAVPAIKRIVNEGIMAGKPNNLFDPAGTATRAEAARIIYVVKGIYEYQMTDGEDSDLSLNPPGENLENAGTTGSGITGALDLDAVNKSGAEAEKEENE